jgi:DNA-binding transcriptional LysR family regulator
MEFDTRQLMNFLAIARLRSFSRAAADRRLSQPALSNSITQLERRVGGRLFERGRHGAKLTPLGETLMRRAENIEIEMNRAAVELKNQPLSVEGPLIVGATPVASASLVPRAVGQLKREFPGLSVHVHETIFHEAMPALVNGSMDLMVGPVGVYPAYKGVVEERLTTDPFTLIVRSGHRLARRRSMSLQDLQGAQWVLPSDHSAFHHQVEALLIVAGVAWPTNSITTNSMVAIKSIVAHSDCVALIPLQLVSLEHELGILHCIRFVDAGGTRALGVSWAEARALSPMAKRFSEILKTAVDPRKPKQVGVVR